MPTHLSSTLRACSTSSGFSRMYPLCSTICAQREQQSRQQQGVYAYGISCCSLNNPSLHLADTMHWFSCGSGSCWKGLTSIFLLLMLLNLH